MDFSPRHYLVNDLDANAKCTIQILRVNPAHARFMGVSPIAWQLIRQ
jgi:hypothetical protein